MRALFVSLLLAASLLAGCTGTSTTTTSASPPVVAAPTLPSFTDPKLIDDVRAGGEPVIAITHAGTVLVAAHPGFTHIHTSPDNPTGATQVVTDYGGQVYLFRSTDNGTTWSPIGLPGMATGPRSGGLGVSDPDFTVMDDGTVCYTDLEGLAAASTSCSSDDGQTWLLGGNPLASGRPVDRQWLASYKGDLYFTADYFGAGPNVRVSSDKGLTWTDRGTTPCAGDFVANAANGHLVQSCNGTGITVSTDGGATWSQPSGPKDAKSGGSRMLNEPALDAAGNAWVTWSDGEHSLHVAGTPDEGKTWPWDIDLTPSFRAMTAHPGCAADGNGTLCVDDQYRPSNSTAASPGTNGTYVWPWVSAASAGRLAVSWIGTFGNETSDTAPGPYYIFTAFVLDATSASPTVLVKQVTPNPIHTGPICQAGTACQATSMAGDPQGDRRLGDFFETTVDPASGFLFGSWANTQEHASDVVGHVQFAHQVNGVRLIAPEDLGRVKPTQG